MIRLTQLPYYVVFISHVVQLTDEYDKNKTIEQPSLEQKYLNMTKGRTDVMIKCQKVGKNYLQLCNEKRDLYYRSDIKDERLYETLSNVKSLFEDSKPTIQNVEPKKVIPGKKPEIINVDEETTTEEPKSNLKDLATELVEKKSTTKKSLLIKKGGNE